MNTPSTTVPQSQAAQVAPTRPLYWSIRRELWETRSIYIAPIAAAILFLFGYLINLIIMRRRIHGGWPLDQAHQHEVLTSPYEMAAALIFGTAFIVGIFYSLDALYGERRDRSILFWKSLPVSDLTVVLSKVSVPIVILPLLSFAITIVTQALMLLLSSIVLLGSGLSGATLWTHSSFLEFSLMLLYHVVTVHGLWYAPLYGWLLLVSAWAPRAPFIWAFLPPFMIVGMEKLAFNTTHFLTMLEYRVNGPVLSTTPPDGKMMHMLVVPAQFFITPGLWIGLAIAAAFLYAAVRLRRYRGPI
jgi:ABC-2 type transport system permease protein